jgi:DNA polymerase-1
VPSKLLDYFREVVLCDTEFRTRGNGLVEVRCVCALELRSGRAHRVWIDRKMRCPYPIGDRTLFVAHYASAEVLSHISLGWEIPRNILDSCVEFSRVTCGSRGKDVKRSLLGALKFFHIDSIEMEAKQELRGLAMAAKRNRDYTADERARLLDYCWSDVEALRKLLPKLEPFL